MWPRMVSVHKIEMAWHIICGKEWKQIVLWETLYKVTSWNCITNSSIISDDTKQNSFQGVSKLLWFAPLAVYLFVFCHVRPLFGTFTWASDCGELLSVSSGCVMKFPPPSRFLRWTFSSEILSFSFSPMRFTWRFARNNTRDMQQACPITCS